MGRALTTWTDRVRSILGNPKTALISEEDITDSVLAAVRKFSSDRPRVTYQDYTGDGATFDLALPAAWAIGFSAPLAVEYPKGQRPAQYIDLAEVGLYPDVSVPVAIRLNSTVPATGSSARLLYSATWPIPTSDVSVDLITDIDYEPVARLGAHIAALELASRAAQNQRPTFASADFAGEMTEQDRWLAIAAKHKRFYDDHLGADDGMPVPADAILDWDASSTWIWSGRQFLFRGRR